MGNRVLFGITQRFWGALAVVMGHKQGVFVSSSLDVKFISELWNRRSIGSFPLNSHFQSYPLHSQKIPKRVPVTAFPKKVPKLFTPIVAIIQEMVPQQKWTIQSFNQHIQQVMDPVQATFLNSTTVLLNTSLDSQEFICPKTPIRKPSSISDETLSSLEENELRIDLFDVLSPGKGQQGLEKGMLGKERQKISFFQFLEMRQLENKRKKSI